MSSEYLILKSLPNTVYTEELENKDSETETLIECIIIQCIQLASGIQMEVCRRTQSLPKNAKQESELTRQFTRISQQYSTTLKQYRLKQKRMSLDNYKKIHEKLLALKASVTNTPNEISELQFVLAECYLYLDSIISHNMIQILEPEEFVSRTK